MGDIISHTNNNKVHMYVVVSRPHTAIQNDGDTLDITVQGYYTGSGTPTGTGTLVNMGRDTFTVNPLPNSKTRTFIL